MVPGRATPRIGGSEHLTLVSVISVLGRTRTRINTKQLGIGESDLQELFAVLFVAFCLILILKSHCWGQTIANVATSSALRCYVAVWIISVHR